MLAGAAGGSLSGASLAEIKGRRGTLLLTAIPLVVGTVLSATSTSLPMMVAGRVITGAGMGLGSGLVPMYISEVRVFKLCQTNRSEVAQSQCKDRVITGASMGLALASCRCTFSR